MVEAGYEIETVRQWLDGNPEMSSIDQKIIRFEKISLMAQQFAAAGVSASAGGELWSSLTELASQAVDVTNKPG